MAVGETPAAGDREWCCCRWCPPVASVDTNSLGVLIVSCLSFSGHRDGEVLRFSPWWERGLVMRSPRDPFMLPWCRPLPILGSLGLMALFSRSSDDLNLRKVRRLSASFFGCGSPLGETTPGTRCSRTPGNAPPPPALSSPTMCSRVPGNDSSPSSLALSSSLRTWNPSFCTNRPGFARPLRLPSSLASSPPVSGPTGTASVGGKDGEIGPPDAVGTRP
mmetsp:Transcript_22401/g.62921  ORF Transcript_22401/g.62921 Transcript_22401/m.62921 type:complete len:219 (+) Transcript_22401:788-1444(+)